MSRTLVITTLALLVSTWLLLLAFSIFAQTNEREYIRQRDLYHSEVPENQSGRVYSPTEFHYRTQATWPYSRSERDFFENRWKHAAGLPLWVPPSSSVSGTEHTPTVESFFLIRAALGALVIMLGACIGRSFVHRRSGLGSTGALYVFIPTVAACAVVAVAAPVVWYLTFDREQVRLPPLHEITPVFMSYVPSLSSQVCTLIMASLLAAIGGWTAAFAAASRGHCARCGYDLAGLPNGPKTCPECGQTGASGAHHTLVRSPNARRALIGVAAIVVCWAVLLIWIHHAHRNYGFVDAWGWVTLRPRA